jgi:outer membrane immunogenic protein
MNEATRDWSGPYLGGFGGWAWGDIRASPLFTTAFGGNYYNVPDDSYGFSEDGLAAGVQAGIDWQLNRFVFGIGGEAGRLDFDKSAEDTNFLPTPFPDGRAVTSFESRWYGAVTGRAGIAFDRVLVYTRVGAAFLEAKASTIDTCADDICGVLTIDADGDDVLPGWTAGGGLEVAMTSHWSIGGEYRYFDFKDLEVEGVASNLLLYSQDVDVSFHQVRGFVDFRW